MSLLFKNFIALMLMRKFKFTVSVNLYSSISPLNQSYRLPGSIQLILISWIKSLTCIHATFFWKTFFTVKTIIQYRKTIFYIHPKHCWIIFSSFSFDILYNFRLPKTSENVLFIISPSIICHPNSISRILWKLLHWKVNI